MQITEEEKIKLREILLSELSMYYYKEEAVQDIMEAVEDQLISKTRDDEKGEHV